MHRRVHVVFALMIMLCLVNARRLVNLVEALDLMLY